MNGLTINPYGFDKFENDHTSFRFVKTKETTFTPALVIVFTIDENRNVVLEHIEAI